MTWHVLTVRPQRENAVSFRLTVQWAGCLPSPEVYLPTWSDGRDRRPLFSGYLLTSFTEEQAAAVRTTPHVNSILGQVSEAEIAKVRAVEAAGAIPLAHLIGQLKFGDQVEALIFGVRVLGSVLEERRSMVQIAAAVITGGCRVWVEKRHVRRAS